MRILVTGLFPDPVESVDVLKLVLAMLFDGNKLAERLLLQASARVPVGLRDKVGKILAAPDKSFHHLRRMRSEEVTALQLAIAFVAACSIEGVTISFEPEYEARTADAQRDLSNMDTLGGVH